MSRHAGMTHSSNSSRYRYAITSAEHERRSDSDIERASVEKQAKDRVNASSLTLDDFGGRSDAPGG
jgi:hypothetical protein